MNMNGIGHISTNASAPLSGVRPDGSRPLDPKLWEAAQQFEEIFLAQLVREMRSSAGGDGLLKKSAGHDTFNEMFGEALAKEMAQSNTLGLCKMIYRDMGGDFGKPKPAAAPPEPDPVSGDADTGRRMETHHGS